MGTFETFRELSVVLLMADELSDMVVDATEECVYKKQRLSQPLFPRSFWLLASFSRISNLMLLLDYLCVKYLSVTVTYFQSLASLRAQV
jgi:hypothetical protein